MDAKGTNGRCCCTIENDVLNGTFNLDGGDSTEEGGVAALTGRNRTGGRTSRGSARCRRNDGGVRRCSSGRSDSSGGRPFSGGSRNASRRLQRTSSRAGRPGGRNTYSFYRERGPSTHLVQHLCRTHRTHLCPSPPFSHSGTPVGHRPWAPCIPYPWTTRLASAGLCARRTHPPREPCHRPPFSFARARTAKACSLHSHSPSPRSPFSSTRLPSSPSASVCASTRRPCRAEGTRQAQGAAAELPADEQEARVWGRGRSQQAASDRADQDCARRSHVQLTTLLAFDPVPLPAFLYLMPSDRLPPPSHLARYV